MATMKLGAVVINARDLDGVVTFWKELLEVGERQRFPGFVWLQRQPGFGDPEGNEFCVARADPDEHV